MTETALVPNKKTPGQLVRETNTFHVLAAPTGGTASGGTAGANKEATGNSGWLDVGFVDEATLHAELGTCTGTGTSLVLTVEQADTSGGAGAELLATFQTADQDDDDKEAKIAVRIDKRYVRATWTIAGTSPVFPLTLSIRQERDRYNENYSGAWA